MVRCLLLIACVLWPTLAGGMETTGSDGKGVLSLAARVEGRASFYGEKVARWRELGERTSAAAPASQRPAEWAGCAAAVEALAHGYGRLKEELAVRPDGAPDPASWQVLLDDIAFLEGGCGQVFQRASGLTGGESRSTPPGQPAQVVVRPRLGEQEQLEKWGNASGLFDSGKYDEAIAEFSCLLDTNYGGAAREKILEAQTSMATRLRRQAATILARKTDDPAQKKKLLEESWLLLNRILTTYPEAAIIDKVRQNQAQIELQLKQLDPALLQRLKGGGMNG